MIKTEIKSFTLSTSDGRTCPFELPASVLGALTDPMSTEGVYHSDNMLRRQVASGQLTLLAEPEVDALTAAARVVLLRIRRADAPATVTLNGRTLGVTEPLSDAVFNVTGILAAGKNRLTLTMDAECDEATEHRASRLGVGNCEILAYNFDVIESVKTRLEQREDVVRLHLSVSTREANGTTRAVATLVSPGGRVFYCGLMGGEGYVDITEPNLWWPNELGVQNLYKLTVNLYADSEIVDSREIRLGLAFPTVRDGSTSALNINGVPLYMRGACYMPDDALMPMCDPARAESLVSSAEAEGMNTLLLPDLGIMPEQFFFDSAARHGISVLWHFDSERHSAEEILQTVSPFLSSVSLTALLVTGREASELSAILAEKITGKAVITSQTLAELTVEERPSLPDIHTLAAFLGEDEMNLFSDAMQLHSEAGDNSELISSALYPYPNGLAEISYVTQMEQAYMEARATDFERNGKTHPELTIFPRLNDSHPAVTRSHIDYLGTPKAESYITRSLFAPVRVSAENNGTRVTFFVSNERKTTYRGRLEYSVLDASLKLVFNDSFDIEVADNTSVALPEIELAEAISGHTDEYFVAYSVSENMITTSKGTLLFTIPRSFKFKNPSFTYEISGNGTSFVLSLSSDVFAHGVALSFADRAATFEDNFFDITDTSPKRIELTTKSTVAPQVLRRALQIRCAYDIGREQASPDSE